MASVTVACVLRSGGVYSPEYVRRLAIGVSNHLTIPYNFVCLSDVKTVAQHIPLVTKWPGWLAKLELFRPGLFTGTVIYLDLDTLVVGSIDHIASYPHTFSMLSDFYKPQFPASGIMAWSGDHSKIFTEFTDIKLYERWSPEHRGDCGWIIKQRPPDERLQDLFPGQIVSRKNNPVSNHRERIVCYHGRPRPHETNWSR